MRALEKTRGEKGASLVEFTFVGIPLLLILISLVEMCLTMWSYHTLAYAVREAARYASTKGQGCTYPGNSCSVSVGTIAQQIAASGMGLSPAQLNVDLISAAGDVSCYPLTSCYSINTIWPPSSNAANVAGSTITISGTYPVQTNFVIMFFPTTGASQMAAVTLAASSQQIVEF